MRTARLTFALALCVLPSVAKAWSETFDLVSPATQMHQVNGWKGWDNLAAQGAFTSSAFSHSGQNSIDIAGSPTAYLSDLVQTYTATSGQWLYNAWQFIPSSTSGSETYFILMNTYNDNGAKNWSTQVKFDLNNNIVFDDLGGAVGSLPLVRDQWVPISVSINLDTNSQTVFYNNQQLFTAPWVRMSGGALSLAAVDLYGSSASHTYYDDISLTAVPESATIALAGAAGFVAFPRRRHFRT